MSVTAENDRRLLVAAIEECTDTHEIHRLEVLDANAFVVTDTYGIEWAQGWNHEAFADEVPLCPACRDDLISEAGPGCDDCNRIHFDDPDR